MIDHGIFNNFSEKNLEQWFEPGAAGSRTKQAHYPLRYAALGAAPSSPSGLSLDTLFYGPRIIPEEF